jgi:hypothetical protein
MGHDYQHTISPLHSGPKCYCLQTGFQGSDETERMQPFTGDNRLEKIAFSSILSAQVIIRKD